MSFKQPINLAVACACAVLVCSASAQAQVGRRGPLGRVPASAVRLEITPRDAEVYVDGYYSGIVDDFDGVFQRLHLPAGAHDITVVRAGYRTTTQKVYLTPDSTYRIRYAMVRLAPGEVAEARPTPPSPPDQGPAPPGAAQGTQATSGTISLRVQPADAQVLIDGQPWPSSGDTVLVDVPEGRHSIQVRKAGYVGYLSDVQVRRGETATVTVTLRPTP